MTIDSSPHHHHTHHALFVSSWPEERAIHNFIVHMSSDSKRIFYSILYQEPEKQEIAWPVWKLHSAALYKMKSGGHLGLRNSRNAEGWRQWVMNYVLMLILPVALLCQKKPKGREDVFLLLELNTFLRPKRTRLMSLIPSLLQSYYSIRLELSVFRYVNLVLCCFKQNTLHTTLQYPLVL